MHCHMRLQSLIPSPCAGATPGPEEDAEEEPELSETSSEEKWSGDDCSFGPGKPQRAAKRRMHPARRARANNKGGSNSMQLKCLTKQQQAPGTGSADARATPGAAP